MANALQLLQKMQNIDEAKVQEVMCKLEKMRCNLQALAWSQMLEFGSVRHPEVLPHNFAGTPYVKSENANGLVKHNFEQVMGKPSTRGHIKNRGEAELTISAWTMEKQAMNPYILAPGDVFDFGSFAIKELSITPPDGESVPYTLFAQ